MKLSCPVITSSSDCVLLGHGSGGRLSHQLVREVFYPAFRNDLLDQDHDGCVFHSDTSKLAFTTDSYVVNPVFFPGGNIGDLAVNGTVNDLACCGAKPMVLSAGFILEEGFSLDHLKKIVGSMAEAARKAGVRIVTGDTKVVERGHGDGIFINTSGIGAVSPGVDIRPANVRPGDVVICSGFIGAHGICILSSRESLGFETEIKSDTTALYGLVAALLTSIDEIHVFRDPTRGGIGTTLNELAGAANVEIEIDEAGLPVSAPVRAASEILGLDPVYIANEGVLLVILPEQFAEKALSVMRNFPEGEHAVVIGHVVSSGQSLVRMKTYYGGSRIVSMLHGDQLPRIC